MVARELATPKNTGSSLVLTISAEIGSTAYDWSDCVEKLQERLDVLRIRDDLGIRRKVVDFSQVSPVGNQVKLVLSDSSLSLDELESIVKNARKVILITTEGWS